MGLLLWKNRNDLLICLLIQCLLLVMGISLQTFENQQTMAISRKDFVLEQR